MTVAIGKRTMFPKRRATFIVSLLAIGALTMTPSTASASAPDKPNIGADNREMTATQTADACGDWKPFGAMCYFFRSNYQGAEAGFVPDMPDLLNPTRWLFRSPGAGAGQEVANNAGSGQNRDT